MKIDFITNHLKKTKRDYLDRVNNINKSYLNSILKKDYLYIGY